MSTKYEPGTVAVIRVDDENRLAMLQDWGTSRYWSTIYGQDIAETNEALIVVRPFLVVDPGDVKQTSVLFHAADATLGGFRESLSRMLVPKVEEPKGIGAVVSAATREGSPSRLFVSHKPEDEDDRTRWVDVSGDWHGWVNLVHPEVLSEGYIPAAK